MAVALVTGATGFVGGHVARLLVERGDEVRHPFADVEALEEGKLDAAGWRERYAEVADVEIASTVSTRPESPEPARS